MCWRVDTAQAHKVKAEVNFGNGVKVMPPILTITNSTHNYDEESLFSRVKDMPPSCEYMDADSVKAVDEAGGIISSSPHAHTLRAFHLSLCHAHASETFELFHTLQGDRSSRFEELLSLLASATAVHPHYTSAM